MLYFLTHHILLAFIVSRFFPVYKRAGPHSLAVPQPLPGARAAELTGGSEALPSGISPQRRAWRQHAPRFAPPVRSRVRAEQLLREIGR